MLAPVAVMVPVTSIDSGKPGPPPELNRPSVTLRALIACPSDSGLAVVDEVPRVMVKASGLPGANCTVTSLAASIATSPLGAFTLTPVNDCWLRICCPMSTTSPTRPPSPVALVPLAVIPKPALSMPPVPDRLKRSADSALRKSLSSLRSLVLAINEPTLMLASAGPPKLIPLGLITNTAILLLAFRKPRMLLALPDKSRLSTAMFAVRLVTPVVARASVKLTPNSGPISKPVPRQVRIVRLSRRPICSVGCAAPGSVTVLNVGVVGPGVPPSPRVTTVTFPVSGKFCAAAGIAASAAVAVEAISARRSSERVVMAISPTDLFFSGAG